ncbi:pyridoxal phosphate-dependent decarboxylase family protein [Streptomyces blattellae]|uniref:pyridoxal phosphate-dependent decarboxylase family protein n=1 Tax=Streptomyces blattellae TaxID=2569855 RepID=UPI0012B86DAE|nr:aminotransferase class V-fold PLP-dependent enzyme [Streptomyces blattellae]
MSTLPPQGPEGPHALRRLLDTVLDALHTGERARSGPLPAGGPEAVAARVRDAVGDVLPDAGDPEALRVLVHAVAEGAADPAHPLCAAHLHCPPLAVATAADLAASALNPSLDSWDQAPAASELETLVTRALAAEIYPAEPAEHAATTDALPTTAAAEALPTTAAPAAPADDPAAPADAPAAPAAAPAAPADDPAAPAAAPAAPASALITTGGTESNQLALLLAREAHGTSLRLVVGANAHHSLPRAAWLLGLPDPVVVPAPTGTLDPAALDRALAALPGPILVAATAGTTDAGLIDPLPDIAALCRTHRARLHIDAAYGGPLLFSHQHRAKLTGLTAADTVTLDLHKLGWQPVAAGLLAVKDTRDLAALHHHADYLNAADDTEAGLPDLLGRALRTTRRPDALKIAVTLKTLGRRGLGELVDQVCDHAHEFATLVHDHPGFELYDTPTISTVLFRPTAAGDDTVAAIRRQLLTDGRAVLGRAHLAGRLWLKATLLNPVTRPDDLAGLLKLVEGTTPR